MKKIHFTALIGASALAMSACTGEPAETAEEGGDAMTAEADAMTEDADAMAEEGAEDGAEDGAETAEAAEDGGDDVEGSNNPVGPREQ